MVTDNIALNRDILRSARFQYSPVTQTVKDWAIDRVIEQNLMLSDEAGLSVKEIEENSRIRIDGLISVLRKKDIENALDRLIKSGRAFATHEPPPIRYNLTEIARRELWEIQEESERRVHRIVTRLFRDRTENYRDLVGPFLECLGLIFADLTEMYVRVLRRESLSDSFLKREEIKRAAGSIALKYNLPERLQFPGAITEFFLQNEPDSIAIKWNMSQNYYVSLALGIDPPGALLSQEIFGNSTFFLDTNVIIDGLEPQARHYRSFEALVNACTRLNIRLVVCEETLAELSRVVNYYMDVIAKVAPRIPDDTSKKVRGIFYKLYYEKAKSVAYDEINLQELYANFIDARKILSKEYSVEIQSDDWCEKHSEDSKILMDIEAIRKHYIEENRRPKGKLSAQYDVLLLHKVNNRQEKGQNKCMIVTLDTLLPDFRIHGQKNVSLAITLDAFLQWISPFASSQATENQFPLIFSEALKYQLLPQETFFDLNDFLVFAEIDWDTKELPAKDVENCIVYIKKVAPNLDPSIPSHREKLHYEISKYFADPGRKYKQELEILEKQIEDTKAKEGDLKACISEKDQQILDLEKRIENERKQKEEESLRRSALQRLAFVIFIFILAIGATTLASHLWAEGNNLFQKILNSWPFFGLDVAITLALFYVLLGKKRIEALGWSIQKIFKDPTS